MKIEIDQDRCASGIRAATDGAAAIRAAIEHRGCASIVLATGASQFDMLDALAKQPGIAWNRVRGFHLDEYIGLPIAHSASFRLYLWQRFVSRLRLPMKEFCFISGEHDPQAECERLAQVIRQHPVDVAFIGIGENGHLAFNDPPADFETQEPYLVVTLDEACRKQQLDEGWFKSLADVPRRAISMSIRQIMTAKRIVCSVPDRRKASAVHAAVEGPVTGMLPASILQWHEDVTLYLDAASASLLTKKA
jgi:glucosamine-6-phosphate deaminase